MISAWRQEFGNPEMAFYFVELAPYTETTSDLNSLPDLRLAQQTVLSMENVGMACTVDLGEHFSLLQLRKILSERNACLFFFLICLRGC
jgi:sialate O-acetylesterase